MLRAPHHRATHTEDRAAGAQDVRTSVPQYDIRTTGQKGLRTYHKNRHGGDVGDDDGDDANGDGGGNGDDCTDEGVGVDVIGKEPTSLGVPPLLSEPHDLPYPTQPYATKLSQFHNSTNPNTTPYRFPTVGAGDGTMGRGMPCQAHRTTYNVRCTTVQHGHTR